MYPREVSHHVTSRAQTRRAGTRVPLCRCIHMHRQSVVLCDSWYYHGYTQLTAIFRASECGYQVTSRMGVSGSGGNGRSRRGYQVTSRIGISKSGEQTFETGVTR